MKRRTDIVFLPLLGGLGNQIFQLSAALYNNPGKEIQLISNLGHQRRNKNGKPEIESFVLPVRVLSSKERSSRFITTKAFNVLLRFSLDGKTRFKTSYLFRLISMFLLCLDVRRFTRFHISRGVGFDNWVARKGSEMAVGYFQSYIWTTDQFVKKELLSLAPKNPSAKYFQLEQHFLSTHIIAIHVRLTDYKNEPGIGMLDARYFERALERMVENTGSEIWLFSDDPETALTMLPINVSQRCNSFLNLEITPNEEWQLMRYASQLFISNSTYSWWAARLAFNPDVKIFTPQPWFALGPQPLKLIPPEWIEIGRFE